MSENPTPTPTEWFVYDPLEGSNDRFSTEADALAHADHLIELSLDDGHWDETVEGIVVGIVTHVPVKTVKAVRAEMTAEEWNVIIGLDDCDEIWDYAIRGVGDV